MKSQQMKNKFPVHSCSDLVGKVEKMGCSNACNKRRLIFLPFLKKKVIESVILKNKSFYIIKHLSVTYTLWHISK